MTQTFARCVADVMGRRWLDYRRATFGRLLCCDLVVLVFLVARMVGFAVMQPYNYFHGASLAVAYWRLLVIVHLIVSRVCAHRRWRDCRFDYFLHADCQAVGNPGESRFLKWFYPRYMKEEDEWDLVIVVEPLLSILYGLCLLASFDLMGLLFVIGGICLVNYGRELRLEIEREADEQKWREQKDAAEAEKERAEAEEREDRRHFASVVSPPRKTYEEVAGVEPKIVVDVESEEVVFSPEPWPFLKEVDDFVEWLRASKSTHN